MTNIDKNMIINNDIGEEDAKFFDVREDPFELYGFYNGKTEPEFKRMPDDVAKNVNTGVAFSYLFTTGGRVRFSTDSHYFAIYAELPFSEKVSHMPLSSTAGFDLYVDDPESGFSRFCKPFLPPYDLKDSYESKIKFPSRKLRHFTINFPTYSKVKKLYVGLQNDTFVGQGMKYKNEKPVVIYGSSITNGACSSRPGNTYPNVISRRMGLDYINLGFGGSCKAEDDIVEYMATLPMCAFISEYDHNARDVEYLENTHFPMYQKIRKAHPDIPYIMISKVDFDASYKKNLMRRDVIFESYKRARSEGDENVYFVDGSRVFRGHYKDMCTVDGTHPTDLGFAMMADAIGEELVRAFTQKNFL